MAWTWFERCLWGLITAIFLSHSAPATAAPPAFSYFARRDLLPNVNVGAYAAVAVADFNGDGRPDVALLGFGTVSVMLATGDFNYNITVYNAPAEAEGIIVADFNHDGHPDIAAVGVQA